MQRDLRRGFAINNCFALPPESISSAFPANLLTYVPLLSEKIFLRSVRGYSGSRSYRGSFLGDSGCNIRPATGKCIAGVKESLRCRPRRGGQSPRQQKRRGLRSAYAESDSHSDDRFQAGTSRCIRNAEESLGHGSIRMLGRSGPFGIAAAT